MQGLFTALVQSQLSDCNSLIFRPNIEVGLWIVIHLSFLFALAFVIDMTIDGVTYFIIYNKAMTWVYFDQDFVWW